MSNWEEMQARKIIIGKIVKDAVCQAFTVYADESDRVISALKQGGKKSLYISGMEIVASQLRHTIKSRSSEAAIEILQAINAGRVKI